MLQVLPDQSSSSPAGITRPEKHETAPLGGGAEAAPEEAGGGALPTGPGVKACRGKAKEADV